MKDLKKELIKLRSVLKKLELVYKTAIDEKQKQRVSHDIKQIRAKINRLETVSYTHLTLPTNREV